MLALGLGAMLAFGVGAAAPGNDRVAHLEAEVARLRIELSQLRSVLAQQGLIFVAETRGPSTQPVHAGVQEPPAGFNSKPSIFDEAYDPAQRAPAPPATPRGPSIWPKR